jgi:two-component system, OmpR family, phosphate regulon sensor histidine kinase PhoR
LTLGFRGKLFVVALGVVACGAGLVGVGAPGLRPALPLAVAFALGVAVVTALLAGRLVASASRELAAAAGRLPQADAVEAGVSPGGEALDAIGRSLERVARELSDTLASLREERDQLRAVLIGMQGGVLLLDREGRIAFINNALREMLLLGSDAIGKTQLEATKHEHLKQLFDHARKVNEPVTGEIELGGLKPRRLLVRVARLPGYEEQVFAVFGDVTEMRRLETLRRDFVANVSHELRTPVTAIRSAAETLQGGLPDDRAVLEQFIGIIARNAQRLHELVEDLLDLSRIESQKLKLEIQPLDLRIAFTRILNTFQERADRRGVELVNDVGLLVPRVLADRRAMDHIVTNLVDNAVKYCGPRSKVVLRGEEMGGQVRILVQDDGPGIEARHLPRLFERFYRVDPGRSREVGGTGLGLSIVKHLAEAMGGTVSVESTPGEGTTFVIVLKKAQPGAPRAPRAVA